MNQEEAACVLADELQDCGHDVTTLDLLDALASCGMELIEPPDPASSDAYLNALRRRALGDGDA